MTRGLGEGALVAELPEAVVVFGAIVTQLGGVGFLLAAVALVYLGQRAGLDLTANPRRDCLVLLGFVVGSYSLTLVLKHVFLLPRPPDAGVATLPAWLPAVAEPLYEAMATSDGYGFPSGHAIQSTVFYGGTALTLSAWHRRGRFAVAGVVVFLVALSRVVLGVHYVVDVVVGVLVGVAFLAAVVQTTERDPARVLGVAAGLGVVAFVLSLTLVAALATVAPALALAAWAYAGPGRRELSLG